ncbi:MAG: hypothetical protein G01um101416_259 [Microgenomates group bacterium Gr01-1014_16]|nr:MAG: hypothetical protein G01um101416_259 [Microgenomates group bacterium Gr01-1014_16]
MDFRKLAPAVVVAAVALWSVWPVVVRQSRIPDYGYDGWFINWVINREAKIISGCIRNPGECKHLLFQGNIYYPYKNTLAYSELFFIDAAVAYFPVILSKNPAVASGWVMAVGQVTTMLVLYFWFKEIAGNSWGAVVGSVAFGLSQIRWEYQVHLQMWGMQYWLVGCWLIIKWVKGEKWVKGVVGAILLGLQMWQTVLPVYFAATIILAALIFKIQDSRFNKFKKLLFICVIAGVVAWPVVRVYSKVSREMGFVRTIRDAAHGSISVNDLWGKFYSPGLFILLAVAVIRLVVPHPYPSPKLGEGKWLILILFIGVVMAMGPTLRWRGETVKVGGYPIPLPYAAAYYAVPGLQASRTTSRWMWLAGFGASGLIALGMSNIQYSMFNKKTLGLVGAIFVAIFGGTHLVKYRELPRPEEFPKVYKWLKDQPGEVILELPRGNEDIELQRMYYSWIHDKKLVNGYSGFKPPEIDAKVDYVIIHKDNEESVVYSFR